MDTTQLKMLWFALEVSRVDRITTSTAKEQHTCVVLKRETVRLRCSGYIKKRDEEQVRGRMLGMDQRGRRKGGRPKRKFMDVVKEDM